MQLGRVVGQVVATQKDDTLQGKTMLVIQPLDKNGGDYGRTVVAVDGVGAGVGERVYCCRGKEASLVWYPDQVVSTECSIVGIVDKVYVE
tara:strand:- start:305 stop:574 length:270 start_codon:yes stop_codon:yes gene_type:complete